VLVAATVAEFGVAGMTLAVLLSGLMLALVGALGLGRFIRHIPHAVTVGFTAGIAVTIAASQLKDLAGLKLSGAEPGPVLPKLAALGQAAGSLNPAALALGVGVAALIMTLRRWRPTWPGMLIGVAAATAVAIALRLPVETNGTRFGGIPRGLPAPQLPGATLEQLMAIVPAALSFTLLGGLESLLSAKVADGMTGRVHRSNMELVAQGLANVASSIFGGICVTGTIARTATNIRAGARTPVSGILHSAFLLAFMMVAAPLARYIPLSALAGLLVVVAWNMAEKKAFASLLGNWRAAIVLLGTFGLTILHDLTAGILAGCGLAAMFWIGSKLHRKFSRT
jgi:SulP family sulfate permease